MNLGDIAHPALTTFFTRRCVMCRREGTAEDVMFDESVQNNVIDRFMWWKPGDRVANVCTQKFGIVFLQFMDDMLDKTERTRTDARPYPQRGCDAHATCQKESFGGPMVAACN